MWFDYQAEQGTGIHLAHLIMGGAEVTLKPDEEICKWLTNVIQQLLTMPKDTTLNLCCIENSLKPKIKLS